MMAHFTPPEIQDNPNGWGPSGVPEQYKDMPYQPFSKSDRMGKVSDWTGVVYQDRRYATKYTSQFGSGNQYAYFHEEDESSFQLVDTTRVQKPPYQRGRYRVNQRNLRSRQQQQQRQQQAQLQVLGKGGKLKERGKETDEENEQEHEPLDNPFLPDPVVPNTPPENDCERQRLVKKWQKQQGMRGRYDQRGQAPLRNRDASVTVKSDWIVIEEMDFPRLAKLSLPAIKDGEDLLCCGALEYYDKSYDRVNVKNERPLQRIDRIFHTVTTTDDPVIRRLAKTVGNVYATDAILATLMCSTRSNYSWDIVVQKIGGKLFLDKRDNTEFDLLTVNETANEPPPDDGNSLNSPRSLALEATFINHNFSQQVLKMSDERYRFDEENPFIADEDESEVASVAYRYRKWDLDNGIVLVARCEHDAVVHGPNGELQFINIKALNEWDSRYSGGVEWRQKLDTQRGAVLANELRNNACKLATWTVQALLAGSDQIKFGYVSRVHIRDSSKHVILGTQQFKPNEFATQINLNMDNAWGILRCIVDMCMSQKDGKYLIMKDPNKPMIRLYDIPDNTFESDEESEEEEPNEEGSRDD